MGCNRRRSEDTFLKCLVERDWRGTEKPASRRVSCISKNVSERLLSHLDINVHSRWKTHIGQGFDDFAIWI